MLLQLVRVVASSRPSERAKVREMAKSRNGRREKVKGRKQDLFLPNLAAVTTAPANSTQLETEHGEMSANLVTLIIRAGRPMERQEEVVPRAVIPADVSVGSS